MPFDEVVGAVKTKYKRHKLVKNLELATPTHPQE